ncbi:MAG: DUF5060 domain-containing protein [Kiritimatiellae bacterium]|nr:DUF5060 domain-containing protein [Kiritimatiellia bacterium]
MTTTTCDAAQDEIVELARTGPLEIGDCSVNKRRVARYERFELTVDLQGEWDNPFDPGQVSVEAVLTAPSGRTLTVPGFFYQEYRRTVREGTERYNTVGAPCWKVRFAPSEVGEYSYCLRAVNGGKEIATEPDVLTSTADTNNRGYIRVSAHNPLYLEYEDGTPFFVLGVCQHISDLILPESFYPRLAAAGGNLNRIFAVRIGERMHWPWDPAPFEPRPDRGFGKMCLRHSWMLDRLLELGEHVGVTHALSLANPTDMQGSNWPTCCYNAANGGPLTDIRDYATNEAARANFKRELRYFVARWGYSTAVFSWNLWNEVNWMPDFTPETYVGWHREMAAYLRQIDWAHHLIHTNYGKINDVPLLDSLPELQLVSSNTYGMKDFAAVTETWTRHFTATYRKPAMFGEFGIGHRMNADGYAPHDPNRVMIHNGYWAALTAGGAGTGWAFGWNWLQHETFYTYTAALKRFVDGIPFSRREWRPLATEALRFAREGGPPRYGTALVEGWPHNFQWPDAGDPDRVFRVESDGRLTGQEHMRAFLRRGASHGAHTAGVNLAMAYPVDGVFAVFVAETNPAADGPPPQLRVTLDGQSALEEELRPLGPSATHDPRNYYQRYAIPVSRGTHRIRVENTGGGNFSVAFELEDFIPRQGPDLQVRGLQTDDVILVWLKHPRFTWLHARTGIEPDEQPAGMLTIGGVSDGTWVAEWFDTVENQLIRRSAEQAEGGRLVLNTPPVKTSGAVRLFRCMR